MTREELRAAEQELVRLRLKHPERTFWIKECGDAFSGGWTTSAWIFVRPLGSITWCEMLGFRGGAIALKRF